MIYYYSDGENKFGPYNFEELLHQPITKESLVWHEGLDIWVKASEVDTLKDYFQNGANTIENQHLSSTENLKEKENIIGKKFLLWSLFIILAIILVSKLAMDNSQNTETEITLNENDNKKPELTTEEDEVKEITKPIVKVKKNPLRFLTLDYKISNVFLSSKEKISGKIINSDAENSYYNIVIKVKYYDKNNKVLESKDFPIDKTVDPKSDINFKIKNKNPEGTDTLKVTLVSAEIKLDK